LPHEEQQRSFNDPDAAQSTRPAHADYAVLGLLPAPEIPEKIATQLSTELPELLSKHVDDRVSWEVSVVCDPLTGSEPDAVRVIDAGRERMLEEGWDLAICITDLPIRNDGRPVVAAVSTARKLAVISLPPLGGFFLAFGEKVRQAGSREDPLDNEVAHVRLPHRPTRPQTVKPHQC
jgi:hypothetical protein